SPQRIPVETAIIRATLSARPSTPTLASRGIAGGPNCLINWRAPTPSALPIAAPPRATSRLSVINCRAIRERDAPNESRTANSVSPSGAGNNHKTGTFGAHQRGNNRDRHKEHHQSRPDGLDQLGRQRRRGGGPPSIPRGLLQLKSLRERGQFAVCLLNRDRLFQATDD